MGLGRTRSGKSRNGLGRGNPTGWRSIISCFHYSHPPFAVMFAGWDETGIGSVRILHLKVLQNDSNRFVGQEICSQAFLRFPPSNFPLTFPILISASARSSRKLIRPTRPFTRCGNL